MPADFTLGKARDAVFAGCGAQLNHNVFAQQTVDQHVSRASFDDLKGKVRKLEPQFVRIFYNDLHAGVPFDELPKAAENSKQSPEQADRWASFLSVVQLAQEANALINITWQSGAAANEKQRTRSMKRFASVLAFLVKQKRITELQWATIANEPNTEPTKPPPGQPAKDKDITPETLSEMYRTLDKELKARGIRTQVGLMGGDVIEGPKDPHVDRTQQTSPFNQLAWLKYMAANLEGVVDAWSVHIYWDYFDRAKIKRRLDGVHKVIVMLNSKRQPMKPMRVYVTEFGVRGRDIEKHKGVDPGYYREPGSPKVALSKTNIAAFQHAVFIIRAAKTGYLGLVKWDCHYGRYDLLHPHPKPGQFPGPPNGDQQYYAIDKPSTPQGTEWQLLPTYFLLRLVTATTGRDWRVRPLTPAVASVDLKQQLVGFQGAGKNLTILGLHTDGSLTNTPPQKIVTYTIDGIPPGTSFQLLIWNEGGGGGLARHADPVVADVHGAVTVKTPLHSVFALTTKKLSAQLV